MVLVLRLLHHHLVVVVVVVVWITKQRWIRRMFLVSMIPNPVRPIYFVVEVHSEIVWVGYKNPSSSSFSSSSLSLVLFVVVTSSCSSRSSSIAHVQHVDENVRVEMLRRDRDIIIPPRPESNISVSFLVPPVPQSYVARRSVFDDHPLPCRF